jgi:hypothetical protein
MSPFGLALDIQRDLLDTGRQSVEAGVELQRALTGTVLDGIESQREAQRRILGLQYVTVRRTIRRTDEETPGPMVTAALLRNLDEQLADLQADRDEAVDTLLDALEETSNTLEEGALDSVDTAEEQLAILTHTLAQLDAVDQESAGHSDSTHG